MAVSKRSLKIEKLARIYDDEIAPVWGSRFGKMLLRNLDMPEKSQVLDISCGTGYPALELLRKMSEGSRLIAIDPSSAMLDVARRKVADLGPLGKKGVFFRTESAVPKLSFADDVYDLVICNLGLGDMPEMADAVADFARVAKTGGQVRCSIPLAGTFAEFHDIYREVLIKHDRHEALDRLDAYIRRYPTEQQCEGWMRSANLDGEIVIDEFELLFKSSREFFFAPVIEYGPLSEWKAIAGEGQELQDVFWYIKEAIDAYFHDRAFAVTVRAGCLIGRKQVNAPTTAKTAPSIDLTSPPVAAAGIASRRTSAPDFALEEAESLPPPPVVGTGDGTPLPPVAMADGSVSISDMDSLGVSQVSGPGEDGESQDIELDAFVEGRKRPPHL